MDIVMLLLREISEVSKRVILAELKSGPRNVTELVQASGLKQPNVSNHLAKLRSKGIIRSHKVGRQVYYSLAGPDVETALTNLLSPQDVADEPEVVLDRNLVKKFARAACAANEAECTQIVDSLLRVQEEPETIYEQLFAESMGMVGEWWMVEAIDEGQEHLASAIVERLMARVSHFSAVPGPTSPNTALVGCCAGNWHSIGARMVADVMRMAGWRVMYLGANVPTEAFVKAAQEHSPEMVMVSCATAESLPDCIELVARLDDSRGAEKQFAIGVGGRAVTENPQPCLQAGADFVATHLKAIRHMVLPEYERGGAFPNGVF